MPTTPPINTLNGGGVVRVSSTLSIVRVGNRYIAFNPNLITAERVRINAQLAINNRLANAITPAQVQQALNSIPRTPTTQPARSPAAAPAPAPRPSATTELERIRNGGGQIDLSNTRKIIWVASLRRYVLVDTAVTSILAVRQNPTREINAGRANEISVDAATTAIRNRQQLTPPNLASGPAGGRPLTGGGGANITPPPRPNPDQQLQRIRSGGQVNVSNNLVIIYEDGQYLAVNPREANVSQIRLNTAAEIRNGNASPITLAQARAAILNGSSLTAPAAPRTTPTPPATRTAARPTTTTNPSNTARPASPTRTTTAPATPSPTAGAPTTSTTATRTANAPATPSPTAGAPTTSTATARTVSQPQPIDIASLGGNVASLRGSVADSNIANIATLGSNTSTIISVATTANTANIADISTSGANVSELVELAGIDNTADLLETTTIATQQDQLAFDGKADWRVRLSLTNDPDANYLYLADDPGILAPLRQTQGVLFPYTPQVSVTYAASYSPTEIVHSNYKVNQYSGSSVDQVTISCEFTAQDDYEANYVLAVIHFFRSMTKMFYGQDQNPRRGTPPPLCYMFGMGNYQFAAHPLAITNFSYNLPTDVDYIKTVSPSTDGSIVANNAASRTGTGRNRLIGTGVAPGGTYPSANASSSGYTGEPGTVTWVPTKIQMNITCLPMMNRNQVSNKFSLKDYATGALLNGIGKPGGGFW